MQENKHEVIKVVQFSFLVSVGCNVKEMCEILPL